MQLNEISKEVITFFPFNFSYIENEIVPEQYLQLGNKKNTS